MNNQQRLNQLTEVLHLYYEEGLNQKEIGKIMKVSVSTVSRMLKEAQDMGMVEIVIKYPYATIPSLAKEVREKYGLKDAFVLPTTGATSILGSLLQPTSKMTKKLEAMIFFNNEGMRGKS